MVNKGLATLTWGLLLVLLATVPQLSRADAIDVDRSIRFDIQAEGLADALQEFAERAGMQIMYVSSHVADSKQVRLKGRYKPLDALALILANTGLRFSYDGADSIAIGPVKTVHAAAESGLINASEQAETPPEPESIGPSYTRQGTTSSGVVVEEIVVTAEKREQNLQDVPLAISAYSGGMLDVRGIESAQDLINVVPGLAIGTQSVEGGIAKVTIRGVGMENVQTGGDPGVPIHINGHYTQSTAYVFRDFLDVERVEVQRGPQGTLYGRNAIGGNINIVTRKPTEQFETMVRVVAGNYGKRQIQGLVSGTIVDGVRGRLVVSDDDRDGYVTDLGTQGSERDTSDYTSVRGSLEIDLTDSIELLAAAYDFDDTGTDVVRLLSAFSNPVIDPYTISTNTPTERYDQSEGGSIDLVWQLDGMQLKWLNAYDKTSKDSNADVDGTLIFGTEFGIEAEFETSTHELQLLSDGAGNARWVTGLFFYREDSTYTQNFIADPVQFSFRGLAYADTNSDGVIDEADPRRVQYSTRWLDADSWAAYGQLDYDFSDAWTITTGLRYTRDEKSGFQVGEALAEGTNVVVAPYSVQIDRRDGESWDEITGKLGLTYHFVDGQIAYASYSRGYKAGGFSHNQASEYDPETVDAYEFGFKGQWLDDRIRTNLAAFYYDYKDKQERQRLPAGPNLSTPFQVNNASRVTSKGFEVEVQAVPVERLTFDLAFSYLNATYDEFQNLDAIFPALGVQDLSGNTVPYAPEFKVYLGGQYEWSLGSNGRMLARLDYSWSDEYYTSGFNRKAGPGIQGNGDFTPSFDNVNARLQWESNDARWAAEVFARNLLDDANLTSSLVSNANSTYVEYLPPRTYGLQVTWRAP